MKTRIFFLLAAMGLLAGCAKEIQDPATETVSEANVNKTVVPVGISQMTKTYMGEAVDGVHKVYWSNGDKIRINGVESDELDGLEPDTQKTVFSFDSDPGTPYNVLYPASIWKDATHITLPDFQEYKENNFADGMNPMAGYSLDGSSITMRHLCAVVKVTLTHDIETNLVAIRFKGRNNEQLKGDFSIDYKNATLTGTSSAEEDKVVKVVHTTKDDSSTGALSGSYYVVIPAGTYSDGFDITVQDGKGNYMKKSKAGSITLEAGKLYILTDFAFVPDGIFTITDLEINSVEEFIAFATDYNNHVYDEWGDALSVKLTSDLVFDSQSSSDFKNTTGIGLKMGINSPEETGEDYYFGGIFDGDDHTISGLTSDVPLFVATGTNSVVKNLTLDNTCSFTFTHSNTYEGQFGSIVGYHKGLLDNVSVAADILLAEPEDDITQLTQLGGLVGRATIGTVANSEYSGLISTSADFTGTGKLMIGGLVGRFTNSGRIENSFFKGAISNEALILPADVNNPDKSNPYTIIGGVVGYLGGYAKVESCETKAEHAKVSGAYNDSVGIIVHKSSSAYYSAVGGIVGEVNSGKVVSCTNGADIMNTIIRTDDTGSDNYSRYMKTGGIVGKNDTNGIVKDCTNKATVYHRSNTRLQSIGGIVGMNLSGATVTSCTNEGDVAHMTTGVDGGAKLYGARCPNLGGVIGENASKNVSDLHNTATITVSRIESKATNKVDVRVGGVIGSNTADIDGGTEKNITNTGKVYFNTNFSGAPIKYCLGGIAGYSSASVQHAVNSGYVHFNWTANAATKVYVGGIVGIMDGKGKLFYCENKKTSDENSAEVNLGVTVQAAHKDCCAGGILGYTTADVEIENCTNSGYVHAAPNNVTITDSNLYVGGITGYLAGKSSIKTCSNTGYTNINAGNNTDNDVTKIFADGGIVGVAIGTAETRVSISNCTWEYDGTVGSRRGTCAGVAAYAKYANIADCDITVTYNMYNHVTAGICGWAVNSTISNCEFHGSKIAASQGYVSGGIVGNLDTGSIVDGCTNECTDITATKAPTVIGEIAAKSTVGTTIKNCGYTGTIAICSDNNFTDGGGNSIL